MRSEAVERLGRPVRGSGAVSEATVTPIRRDGPRPLGEPLLTAQDVADHLRCSVELVYKHRRAGKLRAVKLGAVYRFRPAAVQQYLEQLEREGR